MIEGSPAPSHWWEISPHQTSMSSSPLSRCVGSDQRWTFPTFPPQGPARSPHHFLTTEQGSVLSTTPFQACSTLWKKKGPCPWEQVQPHSAVGDCQGSPPQQMPLPFVSLFGPRLQDSFLASLLSSPPPTSKTSRSQVPPRTPCPPPPHLTRSLVSQMFAGVS